MEFIFQVFFSKALFEIFWLFVAASHFQQVSIVNRNFTRRTLAATVIRLRAKQTALWSGNPPRISLLQLGVSFESLPRLYRQSWISIRSEQKPLIYSTNCWWLGYRRTDKTKPSHYTWRLPLPWSPTSSFKNRFHIISEKFPLIGIKYIGHH